MPPRKPGIERRVNADGTVSYRIRWWDGGEAGARHLSHTYRREAEARDALDTIRLNGWRCPCAKHSPNTPKVGPAIALLPRTGLTFGQFTERHIASLTGVGPGYRARFA